MFQIDCHFSHNPWISRAKIDSSPPLVPVHCQYSSRFTSMEKPILHTSYLLFVELDIFCLETLDSAVSSHLSRLKFRERKTTPDAQSLGRAIRRKYLSLCTAPSAECKLQFKSLWVWCVQKRTHIFHFLSSSQDTESGRFILSYSDLSA